MLSRLATRGRTRIAAPRVTPCRQGSPQTGVPGAGLEPARGFPPADLSDAKRLKALEDENRRLKRIVADQTLCWEKTSDGCGPALGRVPTATRRDWTVRPADPSRSHPRCAWRCRWTGAAT